MRGSQLCATFGGPVFRLKRAIGEGGMIDPRIYPSGAFISQTSGHGDFRFPFEVPPMPGGALSRSEVEASQPLLTAAMRSGCERGSR